MVDLSLHSVRTHKYAIYFCCSIHKNKLTQRRKLSVKTKRRRNENLFKNFLKIMFYCQTNRIDDCSLQQNLSAVGYKACFVIFFPLFYLPEELCEEEENAKKVCA